MFIQKVISYKSSWEMVHSKHIGELKDALEAIGEYINGYAVVPDEAGFDRGPRSREIWEKALYDRGWEIIDRTHYAADGRRILVGNMGPIKNGLCAQIPFGHIDYLSKWLFQQCALAVRHGLVKLPILFIPSREFARSYNDRWVSTRGVFESYQDQLQLLSPLSYQFPFLIVGYSNQSIIGDPEIIEIDSDEFADGGNKVVDRCIEFPPEYHQAGLDILNYFGTYLREQYPEEKTKVRIEQDGLKVRLVVETESGRSEVVEKALHEYELIVTGYEPPEKFSNNDKLIIELKNELRIAKYRLESQQDFIGLQNDKIDKLLNIVGSGLANKQPIQIDFNPVITNQNSVHLNQHISAAIGNVCELLSDLPPSSEAALALKELEGSLEAIESNNDRDSVRKAPAMSKFRRILDKILENGSELNSAIEKIDKGMECAKDLARKYNKIAEWCGLPVVPSSLIKEQA